jgi:hydroxymethylbilane synthase
MKLIIGTRGSPLALTQTNWVAQQLREQGLIVEIQKIKTTGDKILDVPLAKIGGKGLFVKEIEEALLKGEIDIAIHSMKDMPAEIPAGLMIGAIPKREDPRDALITRHNIPWAELPIGSKIGTASLRRQAHLKKLRPDLSFVSLRGNLDTRLRKLNTGEVDAIILAAAGMHRIGWKDKITEYLQTEVSLPAIGQGALAIECRSGDEKINTTIAFLNHTETALLVRSERALLTRLEGGCQVPIAGFAKMENGGITLEGLVSNLDGTEQIYEKRHGAAEWAEALGVQVAELLLAKGAGRILKALTDKQEGEQAARPEARS